MTHSVRRLLLVTVVLFVTSLACRHAHAQLRVVTYNTATANTFENIFSPRAGVDTVLAAIGSEFVNGIAKPIDVLLLQEQHELHTTTQDFVELLNDLYDPDDRTMYARSFVRGNSSADFTQGGSGGRPGLIYNTHTVDLISELAFGTASGSGQPRQTLRYQLRPQGYDSSADFYAYSSHYKADDGTVDQARRLVEATAIRNNSDALGQGVHAIYAGDYNIQRSNEDMYVELLSAGNGQAFDPINEPGVGSSGRWHNESSVRYTHTQSPTTSDPNGLATGGVDDRFDFQLTTAEMLDGEGLSIIPGSYHAFGNNGTHACCNSPITSGTGAAPNVLGALTTASDHLPVVADYQLPAVLSAQLAAIPQSVPLGANVSVDVMVENVANVLTALGADELDYTINVSGDLFGSASGTNLALAGASTHSIQLDTSATGLRNGTVTVATTSQGAMNPLMNFPVSFVVGGGGQVPFLARDDFDNPLRLNSFSQTPAEGAFSSNADGFQRYQVGVSPTIPFSLLDQSNTTNPADVLGVVDAATKTAGWFGITDLENPDNPTGQGTATWEFDITGASELEISIDMAAMGDFEAGDDFFDWTYAIDGNPASPLFTSLVDENGSATYTLADGDMVMLDDPLSMTGPSGTVELSNVFQTLTAAIAGLGDTLTIELSAKNNSGEEAFAFDNLVIAGVTFVPENADFNDDGNVDGHDFLTWQRNLGSGTTLATGDANSDGTVDDLDLAVWQSQYGTTGGLQSLASVPEPSTLWLAMAVLIALGKKPRGD